MKSEKKAFWKRMLARMLVAAMVISMVSAIPAGAVNTPSNGGDNSTEAPAESTPPSPSEGGNTNPATPSTETVTAEISLPFTTTEVIQVEIDGVPASKMGSMMELKYQATVSAATEHTATALVEKFDTNGKSQGYYVGDSTGSGTSFILTPNNLLEKTTESATVTLDATSEHTTATDDGKLLVTWAAMGADSNSVKSRSVKEITGVVQQDTNGEGALFENVGSTTVTVEELQTGTQIKDAKWIEKKITLTVTQKTLTKDNVVASVTPASGTVNTDVTIKSVDVSMTDVDNYSKLHGAVSYSLNENEKYATLIGDELKITGSGASDNTKIKLNVSVAKSAFFGGVETEAFVEVNRNEEFLSEVTNISTDADVLSQLGYTLPQTTTSGQTITYKVSGQQNGVIQVVGNILKVSEENLTRAVGDWKVTATVGGNDAYKAAVKTVTLHVSAGATFEKTPAEMTWLSDKLTTDNEGNKIYSNPIKDAASNEWTYSITAVKDYEGKDAKQADWSNIATINETTGDVTLKTAGEVTVTAARSNEVKHSYTLKVNRGTLEFSPSEMTLNYGEQDSYTLPLKARCDNSKLIDVPEDAEVSWKVSENTIVTGAPKDDTYEVTLKDQNSSGDAEFTATIGPSTRYAARDGKATATFKLNVEVAKIEKKNYATFFTTSDPNGENDGENEWYVPSETEGEKKTAAQNVVFTAKEGYQLSISGGKESDEWKESLTLADIVGNEEEGKTLGENDVIYVRTGSKGQIQKVVLPGYNVDNTAPTMKVEYSVPVKQTVVDTLFFFYNKNKEKLTITVTPTEGTSGISSITWGKVDGENSVIYEAFKKDGEDFTNFVSGETYKFTMDYVEDFRNVLSFKIVDNSGQETIVNDKKGTVVVDSVAPEISIAYTNIVRKQCADAEGKVQYMSPNSTTNDSTTNESVTALYAQDAVKVTITVDEVNFDADRFSVTVLKNGKEMTSEINQENQSFELTLPKVGNEETVYKVKVSGTDRSNNEIAEYTEYGTYSDGVYTSCDIIVDDVAPVVTISYDKKNLKSFVNADEKVVEKADATTAVYNGEIVATVTVADGYFYSGDSTISIPEGATVEWNGNVATVKIPAKEASEDIYTITVDGTDIAGHVFTYGNENANADFGTVDGSEYTSKELLIDTKAPLVWIYYTNNKNEDAVDGFFTGRIASITVEDASFDPSVERVTITAVDANGKTIDVENVKLGGWHRQGNLWTDELKFDVEGNYTFKVSIADNAGHSFVTADVRADEGQNISNENGTYSTQFTVDNTKPTELKVSYSENISTALLNGITFGFYSKNKPLTLNIETGDNISGVQYMCFTCNREKGASATKPTELTVRDDDDYETKMGGYTLGKATIAKSKTYDGSDAQLRGQFKYVVMDFAGNELSNTDQDDVNHSGQIGEIVDSISPTATITYSGAANISSTVNNENPNGNLAYYFNKSELTVPITITEANFISSDVRVSVRRNSESESAYQTVNVAWSETGKQDEYVGYVSLSEANSYYNIKVEYKDHSGNAMQMSDSTNHSSSTQTYVSPRIVLDTTAPVVSVSYAGVYRSGEMDFYSTTAVATIRVQEKNFSAEEATKAITITGQNIDGASTSVPSVSSWSYVGSDTYSATITYSTDSRYTFDMNYSDLAKLKQTTSVKKTFAVDQTAPSNLNISYSTDVWGTAAATILWYDTPVNVTLTAYDVTAGIETITYSYPTKNGVSTVNVGMSDVTVSINAAKSTVEYSFYIPSSVLVSTNQFDGTVNFTAVDRSGNRTSFNDSVELVVDNIAPNATITYTTPVSSDEDADYYDNEFEARVEINEANFNADAVNISIVKDGEPYTNFSYQFTDESVDVHVATIRLSENGEYVITVEYTDKSKNEMVDADGETTDGRYTSRVKIIDKDQPAITITDMMGRENPNQIAYDRNNEDSNGKKHTDITFTVSVEDDHLLEDGIEVSLRGFEPQNDDTDLKTYAYVDETEHYVSGTASILENGKSYAISVKNIENDAVYFLNCSATDQAGNLTTNNIKFSVNRDGSTYYVEEAPGEDNDGYTNTQSEAIIHEISVEQLSQTDVTVVRDSTSLVLKQDEQYGLDSEVGQDENWNDYTYTVYADNFEEDGVYAVQTNSVTEQKDQGGTEQTSSSANNDEAAIRFVMDTVAPEAYISGIDENGQYQTNKQPITVTISDNTLLASAKLSIDGAEETINLTDEFDGTYETTVAAKNHDQNVKVYVTDKAGNEYELSVDGIRVSTNILFLHWEIFAVCGAVLVLLIAIMIGVIVSRKKKRTISNV